MAERLVLCVACSRHVKASETRCPFCAETGVRSSVGDPFRRMAAAAAVAAGVTALTGCGDGSTGNTFGVTSPSMVSLDASPTLVPMYDAHTLYPQDGSGGAGDDSSSGENDASAADGGEKDAPSDVREDPPSVVVFYGIATPMKDAEADGV